MKNATTQNTGATPASTSVFNKIVAVITALSLVFLQTPISGLSSQAMADATDAAQAQLAENTAVDVPLTFENAYITYADQIIAPPATKVTIPGGAAMEFTAEADAGYQLESVKAVINGTEVELAADGNGVYTLTAADVATTSNIYVRAITAPTVEEEVVTVEEPDSAAQAEGAQDEASQAEASSASAPAAQTQPEANTKTEYTYEDDDIAVTARLSSADAVPANAVFQVKPITASSTGYNYDVLMDALNDSDADVEYTADNTLLYDIAFMVPKTDEDGKVVEGEFVEYEPTVGSVAITVVFKKNQLSNGIDAEENADVEVIHLPLSDSALDAAGSTENATDITVSDVSVESASHTTTSVADEMVSFTLNSLSPTIFTTAGSSRNLTTGTSDAVSSTTSTSNGATTLQSQAVSASNGEWDLADDSNTMWMHVVTDQSVTENEQERDASFRLTFSYQLTEDVVRAMDAYDGFPTLVYDLNDMIANAPVKDNVSGSGFITVGTRQLGTYTIEDNVVKIVFTDKAYLHNRTSLEGWFRLTMETDETKLGSDEEYSYTFPGTADVIPIHYVKNVSNGTKWVNSKADKDGNYTLSYTANIKANIELDSLKFIDTIGGMQTLDASSVKVNGTSVNVTTTASGFEFDVARALGTSKVAAGTYTVTYDTKVTAAQLKEMQGNQDTETNTASWKVNGDKDVPGGETTTTLYKPHETIPVTKTITDGKQSHQPGDTVTYEIVFGTSETNLAGLRIADYMTDVQTLQGDITIAYGSTTETMPASAITADDGHYNTGMVTLFDYTFPTSVQGTGPVTVKYTTKIIDAETAKVNGVYGTTNVVNTAQEKRYNTTSTTTTPVPYEKEKVLPVSKTASGDKNANGEWEPGTEITYVLTVGDADTDMAGVNIRDYMTDLQVLQGDIQIRVGNGSNQNLASYVPGAVKYTDDGAYSRNDVTLFDFTMPSNAGKGPVVITYKTKVISQEQASSNGIYGSVPIRNTGTGGNGSSGTSGTGVFDDFPIGKTATVGDKDVSGSDSVVSYDDTVHYTLTFGDASMNLGGATVYDEMTDIQRVVSDVTITKADGTTYTMPRGSSQWASDGYVWGYFDDDNYTQWNKVRVFNYKLPSDIGTGPITIEYDAQIISEDQVKEAGLQGIVTVNNTFTANGVSASTNPRLDLPSNYKHEYQANKSFDRFDLANNKVYWNITVEKTADSAYPIENAVVSEMGPDGKFWWSITEPNQGFNNNMGNNRTATGADFDVTNAVVTTDDGVVLTPGVDYQVNKEKASFTFPVLNERVHINFAFNSPAKIIDGYKVSNHAYANNGWISADAEYSNPGITLMKDGSYDESSRIVEWTVLINPTRAEFSDSNPKRVLFTDQIPEGLTLLNYQTGAAENPTVWVEGQGYPSWEKYSREVSIDRTTGAVTADITPVDWEGKPIAGLNYQSYIVKYKTKLSDEAWDALTSSLTGTQVYENHVKVTAGDDQSFETTGKVEVTSEEYIVKTDSTKAEGGVIVDDSGVQTKAISYTVEINPHGYTLNPGKTLSVVDYIDTNMDLDTASVSIVKVNADGTETPQDGIEISYNDDSRLLKLTEIPDKTHFRLTYKCNARAQGQDTFKNTATLIGAGSHSSSTIEEHKIQTSDAGVRVNSIETYIHKIDENDIQKNLAGAQFQLYKCELAIGDLTNSSEYNQDYWDNLLNTMDNMVAGSTEEAQIREQFKIVDYVPVGDPVTTEDNGMTQWTTLNEHTLYAWKEISAPEGYTASDAYHYFVGYQHIDVNSDQLPQPMLSDQEQNNRKHAAWALDDAAQLANGIRVASMANLTTWTATNIKTDYTSISATKVWEGDSDNFFETRPVDGIQLQLYRINADGTKDALGDPVAVNADENGEWPSYLWSKLPTKDSNGNELKYTVTEAKVPNYSTSYSDNGEGVATGTITVTNKMIPKNTSISVKKAFGEEVSKEQMPDQVIVSLMVIKTDKNGNASDPEPTGFTQALNAQNGWQAEFTSLPTTDSEGHTLTYTVNEEDAEGFVVSYSDNQNGVVEASSDNPLVITNTTPKGKLKVAKSITGDAQLTDAQKQAVSFSVTDADENVVAEFTLADMGEDMTKTIDDLDEGAYTVTETANIAGVPTGYTMTTTYNVANGRTDVVAGETAEVVITNDYQPETTSVPVTKVWNDDNDKAGLRPESVTVHLWNGTTEVGSHTLTADEVDESGNWTYTFENLPKYENGALIEYTLTEDAIEPYRTEIDNATHTITNTYATTSVTIKKVWNDNNNQDGKRPSELKVALSNGTEVTLNAANNWTATIDGLPKYNGLAEIAYTWSEVSMPAGYSLASNTTIGAVTAIANSYTPETTEATIVKVWDDNNNQDGIRPTELTVNLSNYGDVTLNADNNWTATVKDLPKYDNGQEITYTWTEGDLPEGYTLKSSDKVGTVTTITNTHTPETTEASVKKVWDDNENQDGKRPTSLTVKLSNGTEVVLNEANGWEQTVKNLPKYANGEEIAYTWAEENVPTGYELTGNTANGTITTITDTHTPETTEASVKKVWDDNENQDGKRPAELVVKLSNGTEVTLNEANGWEQKVEGLPKYANGEEIAYTWSEVNVPAGYTLTGNSKVGTVTTLTDKHTPETVDVTVKKAWDDNSNQDGIRPASLEVTLSNGDKVTLNAANNWTATIENLPKYADGEEIEYTWTEGDLPEGYTLKSSDKVGTVTTITNTHTPETTSVTVKKTWDDADNQDGIQPTSLVVALNNTDKSVVLSAANDWTATIEGLPKYLNGTEVEYTWSEAELPEGYELTDSSLAGIITSITNSYTPEETEATVTKIWDDNNNQDGKRPTSLEVTLSNGTKVTLNADNDWTATVKDLPKYDNGKEITYTWTEGDLPEGYELTGTSVNGTITSITNSYQPEKTSATVKKIWDDNENQDGIRPKALDVTLSNGTTVTLNEANHWEATVDDLPVYSNGVPITYTWTEGDLPAGYELTDTSVNGIITTLTNTHVPEETSATVKKVWDDANDQDGIQPEELVVTLSNGQDVTLNAENGWTATVDKLPKKANGADIVYTWSEKELPQGYELTSTDREGTVTTLTNTHVPEQTSATVKKVWDDAENQDGIQPEELVVTLSNGQDVALNAENGWTATVTGLPKYKAGEEIAYTWSEKDVPEGYELTDTSVNGIITTLTNTHTPETTEATVKKVWDDRENQDGIQPDDIVVTLSDGTDVTLSAENGWTATVTGLPKYEGGVEIAYTWSEKSVPQGYELTGNSAEGTVTTLTNTHTPEKTSATVKKVWDDANDQDGIQPEELVVSLSNYGDVTLSAENGWTATVTDLDKYKAGSAVEYKWTEKDVPEGYELTGNATEGIITTLTNTHTPETTEATVKKVWDDNENQDGIQPDAIVVTLSDGTDVTLSAENGWTATVTGLPKYEAGEEIAYTWSEKDLPEGYTLKSSDKVGTVTTLTNSYSPEETSATVKKVWDDKENQDGIRPAELMVNLSNYGDVTLSAENGWQADITGLPKYDNGVEIAYTWSETNVPAGYELTGNSTEGTVTTLTNTHTPETTEATVKKVWDDRENQDGIQPDDIVVTLSNGQDVTLNAENGWTATVKDLPKYDNGQEIAYTWSEKDVPEGYELQDPSVDGKVTTLTNYHKPAETSATIVKVWDDANDQDGVRPAELTVNLSNYGDVTLSAENGWTATVTGLPKYEAGEEIAYTWSETNVPAGYELTGNATSGIVTTLTNTHTPETTEATIVKIWDDRENQDGIRPLSLVVTLSTGDAYTLDADNNWSVTVDNLPKYANGTEIVYTWAEGTLPAGYELQDPSVDGKVTTLTNYHKPAEAEATIVKVWDDSENQDGKQPEELKVTLSNGQEVTLNADNDWTAKVTGLPKYANGVEISYTWTEGDLPEGYELTGTTSNGTITTLTNSYDTEETSATIKKVWNDGNNQDGIRPATLTATLSDGQTVTLSAANNWTDTITGLPKYASGQEIAYTWSESGLPEGYELTSNSASGLITSIANGHTPETTEATIVKEWDDNENQDGIRPATLVVNLSNYGDVVLSADNDWTATVEDLPKYANGQEIEYTWSEVNVPAGYTLQDPSVDGKVTTLTNKHIPETTEATIVKAWDDNNNQDGIRPAELTVNLSNYGDVTLTADNDWTATVTDLPKYEAGEEIEYTWTESEGSLPEGYTLKGSSKEGIITTLTNYHKPAETEATIIKVWDDVENQDGMQPETLVVSLSNYGDVALNAENGWTATVTGLPMYANGQAISYTWSEKNLPEGYELTGDSTEGTVTTLTNTHKPEETQATIVKVWDDAENQDGMQPEELVVNLSNYGDVTLSAENGWTATVDELPKYEAGEEIEYTWTEKDLPEGYELTGDSTEGTVTTLTNTHTPETVDVKVRKVWNDNENQDGIRPLSLVVALSNGNAVTLNADNGWTDTITGLPKYANGTEISYTWTEGTLPAGYTLTNTEVSGDGLVTTLTNSHTPEQTEATVKKVWNDSENQDGKRPETLTVTLSDGQSVTLSEDNDWTGTITGLPKYANGTEIAYTWTEGALPEGYTLTNTAKAGTITTLTNSYNTEETSATVKKVWDDAENQDGIRPAELTVTLSNGDTVTLNAANHWEATISGLPAYSNGKLITYTWTEGALPEGYALTNTSVNGTITTLTNTHTPEQTSATVKKVWDDAENQDGKRPETLTVELSNGNRVTLTEANGWKQTIGDLPKYADGELINYTWSEVDLPAGYELTDTSKDGLVTTLTNSHTPEETSATVKKVWNDSENQDGKRPETLTVTLSNGQSVTLSEENGWTDTITGLPKYANGKEIAYTWTEGALPDGYEFVSSSAEGLITTITNKHTPELTEATVKKVWDDAENQDGIRPASLTVTLSNGEEVELAATNNWTATITGLPKYAGGKEIVYTWTESEAGLPEGYTLSSSEKVGTVTTLTNSYSPEETSATVKKVWDDAENQDGKRPESLTVALSNGDEVTLDDENGWTATITGLPKYANGEEIVYTWTESTEGLPQGYSLTSNVKSGTVTTLTNSYTPEQTSATVKKVWDDAENQDGKRPETLTVTLSNGQSVTLSEDNDWTDTIEGLPKYANGTEIAYTWTEGTLPEGYTLSGTTKNGLITTLTNSYTPELTKATVKKVWDDAENQDGKRPETLTVTLSNGQSVTLSEANNWQDTITGLPKYAGGEEIAYTWTEGTLPQGYTLTNTAKEGVITTLTNSYTPELVDVTVKKVWDDAENQDGKRPVNLNVVLSNGMQVTLNAANNWEATVEDLPKYANGQEIAYSWTEIGLSEKYTLTGTATDGLVTTLTNSYDTEETSATVKKIWDDNENQDGIRPASLTVTLSNGTAVELNATNNWEATVEHLPVYSDGIPITYTWTEGALPEGYELTDVSVNGTITTLTNSHTPEETSATVKKVWNDNENQDGKRPASLTVRLSNGNEVTLNEANEWTQTIQNLPKYAAGKEIVYSWTEVDLPAGYELTDTSKDGLVTTLTNTHTPEETSATVKKVWDDANDQDGIQPESLTVALSNGAEVTLNADNGWEATVENLPKYANGKEIAYTWTEVDLPSGYALSDTSASGTVTTLTNTHVPDVTSATVKKVWSDGEDQDGIRPDALTVVLSNGAEATLTADNGWTATIGNLPKYAAGVPIVYTWTESEAGLPEGYTLSSAETEGLVTTLTNSYTPEQTSATVKKVWDDAENQDGIRPASLTVTLSNGDEVELNADNGWTATITGLPKYTNGGQLISYTWTEGSMPEGYALSDTSVNGTVTTLTNTHVPDVTSATVKKVWDDANNQDGIQPESLTVTLSNGTEVTLNADNGWEATVENLPKNANGKEIAYTWTEGSMPEGYRLTDTSKDGLVTTLTNTHVPETTAVTVGKTWSDNENQDGMRPSSIVVHLFADNVEVDSATVSADENGAWSYRFIDLPVYRDGGTAIGYRTTEDVVSRYATEVSGFGLVNTLRTGDLVVTKTVENTMAQKRFAFTVTLDDERVNGQHGDLTFVDGVATFELSGGERAEATGLPVGVGYTVTEEAMVGYETTSTGSTGTIEAGGVSTAAFTNVYNASASVEFVAMKALDGRTLGPAEFSFALNEKNAETGELSLVGEAVNNGAGEVRFGAIRYTMDDLGVHDYVLTETAGDLLGVTYDSKAHEFSVNVTDNGDGTLGLEFDGVKQTAEKNVYAVNTGAAFTNTYKPSGSVELEATKVLEGATLEAGAYTFEVSTGVGDDRKVITTTTNDADGNVKFPALTFSAAGTYKYTISEVVPANAQTLGDLLVANGVAYDTHAVDVTIVTTDDFHGNLNCAVSYDGVAVEDGGAATFSNSKVADAEYPLTATKHMQGREFKAGDQFTFSVTADDERAPLPENTSVTVMATSGTDAPIDFGNITFTTDDLGKTYTYTIAEERSGETVDGLQYDPFAHWVKLTIVDAGDGTMGVRATYQNDGNGIVFTNTYTAETEAVLTATKVLEGRDLADGEFFFELSGGNLEAPLHASAAADGTVTFAPVKFTQDDAGKDFTYTISETLGTLGGVTYDESTYDVTLHVTDAGDGTMSVSYDWGEAGAAPVFTNTYRSEATSAALEAHKMLVGGTLTGGEFSFTLTGVSENAAATSQTATNDANGLVSFDAIDYDTAGVYEYSIAEVIPADATDNGDGTFTGADGIVYDGKAHTATVTVTDNGYGKLVAEVAYDEPAGISFGNTALARTGFEFDKYFYGGVGTFDFTLTAVDASGTPRAGAAVDYSDAATIVDDGTTAFTATVQNGAFDNGVAKVVFPEIGYTADGDYYYLVVENESSTPGMVVDEAQYLVHVTVANGVAAEPVYELVYEGVNYGATTDTSFYNNAAVTLGFNSLSVQGYSDFGQRVSVYPEAQKYLNGSTDRLVGGDFTFELVDQASGQVIAVATNDETGKVAFFDENTDPGLAYDEPGEYYYLMREVAGDEAGMTYDDSVILMTVTVEQTDDGLVANVTYNGPGGAEPAFYNTKEGMDIAVYKVSRFGGEGLDNCTYALWMAGENGDVILQEATSDETGLIVFKDVTLIAGQKYFFKEVEAPKGHTVDPYRTAYFSLNETGDALVLVEDTASDGWHSANENIELDKAKGEEN